MPAPDRRVYFTSAAHRRTQWEKPARAAPPPNIPDPRETVAARIPHYGAPPTPAPPPRQMGCPPGDWKTTRFDGDVFWFSYNLRVSQWGVFLSVVYGFISVGAGVWSELLLKKGTKGIHLDNSQLYAYGMFFNFVGVLVAARTGGEWRCCGRSC